MDRPRGEVVAQLAIGMIAGVVSVLALHVDAWRFDANAAAWVQAIGSIGAIVAAAMIATSQRRHDASVLARDALLHAIDAAMVLMPAMEHWEGLALAWIELLNDADGMGDWVMIANLSDPGELFEPPHEVAAMVGTLRSLGPAAASVQRAIVASAEVVAQRRYAADLWDGAEQDGNAVAARALGAERLVPMLRRYAHTVLQAAREVRQLRES